METKEVRDRVETWLGNHDSLIATRIPAARADWLPGLAESAGEIEVSDELKGTDAEKDLVAAKGSARAGTEQAMVKARVHFLRVIDYMEKNHLPKSPV